MKTILIVLFTAVSMAALAQDASVVQLEYFFDTDAGIGKNMLVNVVLEADGTFPFTANISGLAVGYHKLYIRTKDSNGRWSFTARRNVEVFTPGTKTNIVSGEYFLDNDPGFGDAIPITVTAPDSAILQNFTAATTGLTVGYHKLYGRFKDNLGRWSLTFRRNIEIYKNDSSYITKAEYFFKKDNGFGNCTDVTFAKSSADSLFIFNIPLSAVTSDTLFVRAYDNEGKWSMTVISDTSFILPLTLVDFNVAKQNNIAQLNWQTDGEINTAYFNIQRSTDGRNFSTVAKVNAKGASKIQNNYTYSDDISQLYSAKIYYRLQMTDNDDKFSYSSIKYIDDNHSLNIAVVPNPVTGNAVKLNIFSPSNNKFQLNIYDDVGKLMYVEQFDALAGNTSKSIYLSNLSAGTYLIRISDGATIQTTKFIKQ